MGYSDVSEVGAGGAGLIPESTAQYFVLCSNFGIQGYGSLFLITLAEALLKEPITDHEAVFTTVWTLWVILSVIFFLHAIRSQAGSMYPTAATRLN